MIALQVKAPNSNFVVVEEGYEKEPTFYIALRVTALLSCVLPDFCINTLVLIVGTQ
jgi:hypothetical protein